MLLMEEYRPAWEIQPGWEIRTEDGQWLQVTGWFEYTSTDVTKDNVIVLHLADSSECRAWADNLIMTRVTATPDTARVSCRRLTGT